MATPDQVVTIEEKLLGSNLAGYAVMRIETDNLGSYYSSRIKRYLVEYRKEGDGPFESAMPRQTSLRLITDTTAAIDPTLPPEQASRMAGTTINEKDSSVSLADLFLEYPSTAISWDAAKMSRITTHQQAGIRLDNGICLVWGETINEQLFKNRYPDLDWQLDEILQDENVLFLRISKKSSDEISESHLLGIPPRRSRQVMDHLTKQPFYLIAGSFSSLEEARKQATSLVEKIKASGVGHFMPEIWSAPESMNQTVFLVADSSSSTNIHGGAFKKLETRLGVELIVRSSEDFLEKFPLGEPPFPASR